MNKNKQCFFYIFLLIAVSFGYISLNQPGRQLPSQAAKSAFLECTTQLSAGLRNKSQCYYDYFFRLSGKNDTMFAFDSLHELQAVDPDTRLCHLIAHSIGRAAYNNNPKDWKKTLREISPECNYGALHGVVEGYSWGGKKLDTTTLTGICGEKPYPGCIHGLGHVLLVNTGNNIDQSLKMCTAFNSPGYNQACMTGVFMESMIGEGLFEHGYISSKRQQHWIDHFDDFEKMCSSYTGEIADNCWAEIPDASVFKFKNTPAAAVEYCNQAPTSNAGFLCRRHTISALIALSGFDLKKQRYICELPVQNDPNYKRDCYSSLIASASSSLPVKFADTLLDYCNSIPVNYQNKCFQIFNKWLVKRQENQSNIDKICQKAGKYRSACQGKIK